LLNFSQFSDAARISTLKWLEIDQDNLYTKLSALDVDFSS